MQNKTIPVIKITSLYLREWNAEESYNKLIINFAMERIVQKKLHKNLLNIWRKRGHYRLFVSSLADSSYTVRLMELKYYVLSIINLVIDNFIYKIISISNYFQRNR